MRGATCAKTDQIPLSSANETTDMGAGGPVSRGGPAAAGELRGAVGAGDEGRGEALFPDAEGPVADGEEDVGKEGGAGEAEDGANVGRHDRLDLRGEWFRAGSTEVKRKQSDHPAI